MSETGYSLRDSSFCTRPEIVVDEIFKYLAENRPNEEYKESAWLWPSLNNSGQSSELHFKLSLKRRYFPKAIVKIDSYGRDGAVIRVLDGTRIPEKAFYGKIMPAVHQRGFEAFRCCIEQSPLFFRQSTA